MSKSISATAPPASELKRIFGIQQRAYRAENAPAVQRRRAQLQALRAEFMNRRKEIQSALHDDFRKPPAEVDLVEIQSVKQEMDHALSNLEEWTQPKSVSAPNLLFGTSSEIRYEPKGVVLIISPWNYPISLTLNPLISALAAGNRVMLKPSEFAPAAGKVLQDIIESCFPEEEVVCVRGDRETAQTLLDLPFDHIFFTGSPRVGKLVMEAAAKHLASVTLELGGQSPAIVGEDVDVDDAAWKIVWSKFDNAGQTCLAPNYALVPRSREVELIYALRVQIREFYGTTAKDRQRSNDLARLVRRAQFDHVNGLLEDAIEKGARIAEGGETQVTERYIAPTILADVPPESRVLHEEIFGPLLPIVTYDTLDEAINFVNDRPRPLNIFIYGNDDSFVDTVITNTSAGGTCINDVPLQYFNPNLPFGGVGQSGFGRSHGEAGFRTFSNERSVVRRTMASSALQMLAPPTRRPLRQILTELVRRF